MDQDKILINNISIKITSVVRLLGAIAVSFIVASYAGQLITYITGHGTLYGLIPLFNVDRENNFPAFFSALLLLFSALLIFIIALLEKNRKSSLVSKWGVLSIGFLYLAADETLKLHEMMGPPMTRLMGDSHLGLLYFTWVIPGIAIVIIVALFFLRFLLKLDTKTRINFLIAGTLYVGGAIGFELIGGRYVELHGQENLTYSTIATIEESLEMAGSIVFVRGLLVYISDNFKAVQFQVK